MRYLSLLFILALMFLSWRAIESSDSIPETTHIDIQDDIKLIITQTLEKSLPELRDLRFDRFWTQNLGPNKLKATFFFSFENAAEGEEAARYGFNGHAVLNYDDTTGAWDVEGPHIVHSELTFKKGLMIRPGQVDGE